MTKLLFGYLFVKQKSFEEQILVRGAAHFPIARLITVQEEQKIGPTIDTVISDFFTAANISLNEVRKIGFSDIFHTHLYKRTIAPHAETAVALPYIFFKLGLQVAIPDSWLSQPLRWVAKSAVVEMWNDPAFFFEDVLPNGVDVDPYKAVIEDRLVEELGMVLECVDVLLYRVDEKTDARELLLIQRRDNQQWEFPQGGLHYHETLVEAALREVWEKLRIDVGQLDSFINLDWHMDIPHHRGFYDARRIYGFSAQYKGRKAGIVPDPRYRAYAWLPIADVRQRLRQTHAIDFLDRWENS